MTAGSATSTPARGARALDGLRRQLEGVAALGGVGVIAPAAWGMFTRRLPPFDEPPRTPAEDREVLRRGAGGARRLAGELGVALLLEPLNRYEDHMVNTVAQAAALIADAGARGLGILADTYHMNIEEDDLCAALGSVVPVLGAVHLSDSNRAQPGTGHVPFERVISTLREAGWDGVLSVECRLRGEPCGGRARVRRLPARARRRRDRRRGSARRSSSRSPSASVSAYVGAAALAGRRCR